MLGLTQIIAKCFERPVLPRELKPMKFADNVPPPGHKTQLCYSLTPLYFIFYSVNRRVSGDVASSSKKMTSVSYPEKVGASCS